MFIGDIAHMVEFSVVFAPSPYNYILGHPTLNQLKAKVPTCDLSMEIPNEEEVHLIYGDQKATQECYIATAREVERMEQEFEENGKIPKLESEG